MYNAIIVSIIIMQCLQAGHIYITEKETIYNSDKIYTLTRQTDNQP